MVGIDALVLQRAGSQLAQQPFQPAVEHAGVVLEGALGAIRAEAEASVQVADVGIGGSPGRAAASKVAPSTPAGRYP